jgi:hypothetical protein
VPETVVVTVMVWGAVDVTTGWVAGAEGVGVVVVEGDTAGVGGAVGDIAGVESAVDDAVGVEGDTGTTVDDAL